MIAHYASYFIRYDNPRLAPVISKKGHSHNAMVSSTALQENHLIEKPFPPLIHRDDGGALDDIEDKRAFYL